MIRPIRLSDLTLPVPSEGARQRTLEAVERFRKADEEIKKLCKKHGFTIPEVVCRSM